MIYIFLKKAETWLLIGLLALLSACAQGPTLSNSPEAITTLPDDKARVFVYRDTTLGAAIKPVIKINGVDTKDCIAKGVFIAELNEGQHTFFSSTEIDATLPLYLKAGDVKYVRCRIGFGLLIGRVYLKEIPASEAEEITKNLVYTGTYSQY